MRAVEATTLVYTYRYAVYTPINLLKKKHACFPGLQL